MPSMTGRRGSGRTKVEMDKKGSLLRTYGFVAAAIVLSKLLGLGRDVLLAYFYGTSYEAAAFTVAARIPTLFFDITLGTAVASAFIPVFNEYIGKGKKERAFDFLSVFVGCAAVIAIIASAVLFFFSGTAVKLMASAVDGKTAALASALLKILSPVVLIAVLAYIFAGLLQSLGEFRVPSIMSLLCNGVVIAYYLTLNGRFGIYGLAAALLVGWLMQLAVLLPPMRKKGVRIRPRADFRDEGIKQAALLALPVMISSWVQPINTIIASNVSSYLGDSAYVSLNYAYQIYFMAAGVFSLAMTNLLFPRMSRMFSGGRKKQGGELLGSMLGMITAIVAPVAVYFILMAGDIISVIYERGAFSVDDSAAVGLALMTYSFGMLGLSWQEVLNKFFYSAHDSKTPMYISICGIAANLALSIMLMRRFGLAGIAAASAAASTLMAAALFAFSRRTGVEVGIGAVTARAGKIVLCAAVSGAVLFFIRGLAPSAGAGLIISLLKLAGLFAVQLLVYLAMLRVMLGRDERRDILSMFAKEEQVI